MALYRKVITDYLQNKAHYLSGEASTIFTASNKILTLASKQSQAKHTCEVFGKFLLQFHGSLKCLPGLLFC